MRGRVGWRVLAAAAIAILATPADAADRIKATVPVLADTAYAMYHVAQEKGYFAAEDLDVEIVVAGGGVATPALISGDVQFTGSSGAAIPAILRGAPLKLVMVTQDHPSYQLWASDPAIKTLKDLVGKQVGVISRGDSTEAATRRVLQNAGVDPNSVAFSGMSFPNGRATALLSGALPAAALTFDDVAQVENSPKAHLLADISKMVSMVVGGAVSSDKMIQNDRPRALRFLRAVIKGFRYVKANENGTLDILMKRNPGGTREHFALVYDRVVKTMTKDGTVSDALAQQAIDENGEVLGIPPEKRRKLDEFVDFSLAREVNHELDQSGWKPQP
ncbi:MAG TPA: ABC transporter substrate-binding protein [Stellaceae bacterium]|nr:ABC transporter substrate-binding protein [Stellaceae bacterium]